MASNLYSTLKTLDSEMLLNDGATTWTVENLIDAIDKDDETEYATGATSDGRTTIEKIDARGFRVSPPAYVQAV